MKTSPHLTRGILAALSAALLFGASTPLAKIASAGSHPVLIAGLLYLGSGLGLALLRLIRSASFNPPNDPPIVRSDLPWLAGAILFGGVAAPILLLLGLQTTPGSTASLLLNLEAIATATIAWVVFRENVDRRILLGFALILVGSLLLSFTPGSSFPLSSGALLIAAACLGWGIDNNLTRKISASDPFPIAMWKGLAAGTVNLTAALLLGAPFPAAAVWGGAALIGFFGYGLSLVLFIGALRNLGTARTSAYFSMAPFAGAAFSFALGQGNPTAQFVIASAFMLGGVWLHLTEHHEHLHVHPPGEHTHRHVHDAHHQHEHSPNDPAGEPHSHHHRHPRLVHSHPHYPDTHHQHDH